MSKVTHLHVRVTLNYIAVSMIIHHLKSHLQPYNLVKATSRIIHPSAKYRLKVETNKHTSIKPIV